MAVAESFALFIEKLSSNLKKTLPGETAHRIMEALSATYLDSKPGARTRKSAVLILFYPSGNGICFPLILRTPYGIHSNQIAFPGGGYELSDSDLIHTALREAQEEIGLKIDDVKILGMLTEIFIAPSNFQVLPVVGYMQYRPDFKPNASEVERIFETNLAYFSNPDLIRTSEIPIPGELVVTPHYELKGHKIWGATAKVISELLAVMNGSSPG